MERLTDEEREIYSWQLPVRDFGEEGQIKLKHASALVTRLGGLGGPVALELAAAGIGKLVLAHKGDAKPSDLNRQILMRYDGLGSPRADQAAQRIRDLNPRTEVVPVNDNVREENVESLVSQVDIVFDCAPLFEERFAMNSECVRQRKPMIDSAMFHLEGQVTTILPGKTPCLACIYPEAPPSWKRRFPVFGAVSCAAACFAAVEGIKVIAGMKPGLAGTMLYFDMETMRFRKIPLSRKADCPVCGHLS